MLGEIRAFTWRFKMRTVYFERIPNDDKESEDLYTERGLFSCEQSYLPRIGETVSYRTTGSLSDPFVATANKNNYPGQYKVISIHHCHNLYSGLSGVVHYYAEVMVERLP